MKTYSVDDQKAMIPADSEAEQEKRKPVPAEMSSEEVYPLPPSIKSRTLLWSVLSIILAALGLVLCKFYYIGIVFSLVSLGFALISRKNLGFFDKYSILGIIFGVMGFIANIFSMFATLIGIF
jgi:hypothetical protein